MQMTERKPVVGLLYAGEMGSTLGRALCENGVRVVTTVAGRGPQTVRRAADAGFEVLDAVRDVAAVGDVVLSVVPPVAAEAVAAEYARSAALGPPDAIYVDVNSVAPQVTARVGRTVTQAGREFVDAAVNGLAKNLSAGGTLFLSGGRAADAARLFTGITRVRVLGEEPGVASGLKMVLSGVSKGVCGLYVELALAARGLGVAGAFADEFARIYPGIAALVERMLPTYARHAERRAEEMAEVERTARSAGLEPILLTAVRRLHEDLARALPGVAGNDQTSEQFLEDLATRCFGAGVATDVVV
jgi:3-hydroxyisobutyrate dehydrogenase-like beta-hydroxyacid dehydrogenase